MHLQRASRVLHCIYKRITKSKHLWIFMRQYYCDGVSGLITVRIPEDLQVQMKKYKVNWSDRIRVYIEAQVKQFELLGFLKNKAESMKRGKMHADSTAMIREDRDFR